MSVDLKLPIELSGRLDQEAREAGQTFEELIESELTAEMTKDKERTLSALEELLENPRGVIEAWWN